MKRRLLCFDMDGTIVNSMPMLEDIATEVIQAFYGKTEAIARASYRRTTGHPFRDQLEILFPYHETNDRAAETYEQQHEHHCPTFELAPNISMVLHHAQELGHVTALVTSTDRRFVKTMLQLNTLDFDFVGGWMPDYPKSAQMTEAMKLLHVYEDTILFGDTLADAQVAFDFLIPFVPVTVFTVANSVLRVVNHGI